MTDSILDRLRHSHHDWTHLNFELSGERETPRPPRERQIHHRESLTPREMEVLRLIAEGLTTKEIAVKLGIAFKTAACHRHRILMALDATSTVTAVLTAIRRRLIKL